MVRLSVWSRIHVFLAPLSVQTSLNQSWVVDLKVICDIGHCSVYQGSETTVPHQEGTRCGSKGLRLETRTSSLRSIGPGSCLAMLWCPLHVWTQCGTLCLDTYTPWVDIVCTEAGTRRQHSTKGTATSEGKKQPTARETHSH